MSKAIMSAGVDDRPLERLLTALPSGIRRLFTRVLHPEASCGLRGRERT
jgi:hypothetical protein